MAKQYPNEDEQFINKDISEDDANKSKDKFINASNNNSKIISKEEDISKYSNKEIDLKNTLQKKLNNMESQIYAEKNKNLESTCMTAAGKKKLFRKLEASEKEQIKLSLSQHFLFKDKSN